MAGAPNPPLPAYLSECTRDQLGPFLRARCPALSESAIAILFEEEFDGRDFLKLTDPALEKLGVKMASRMKILALAQEGIVLYIL